jgi:CO dehydrogenase nickel-insertion accessory protein CooC1
MSKETSEKDEFDMMLSDKDMNKSLSEKLGVNKKEILKKPKQAKKKTKSPWSDSESG